MSRILARGAKSVLRLVGEGQFHGKIIDSVSCFLFGVVDEENYSGKIHSHYDHIFQALYGITNYVLRAEVV
jgi:hypothetical protein